MNGRVCVVTGANSGIGHATAVALAERRATLILVCRERERGESARREIVDRTGNRNVLPMLADLSSQAAIRNLAGEIARRFERVHLLVNSAGATHFERTLSVDGIEMNLAVNVLAPFLLTELLLERLRAGAASRVVTLTGRYRAGATFAFEDPELERDFSPWRAVSQAGLAKIWLTKSLALRLAGTQVTSNCIYPGAVRTALQRKLPWYYKPLAYPVLPFFQSPRRGARGVVALACAPEHEATSGHYFEGIKDKTSTVLDDGAAAGRCWQLAETLTHGALPLAC